MCVCVCVRACDPGSPATLDLFTHPQVPGSFYLRECVRRRLLSKRRAPYLPAECLSNRRGRRSAKRISILVFNLIS